MTFDFSTLRDLTDVQAHRREVETATLKADLRAKAQSSMRASSDRRLGRFPGPSPQSSVDAFDERLADVIDLDSKRGGRRG